MKNLVLLYRKCKKSGSVFLYVIFRFLYLRLFYGLNIFPHQNVVFSGLNNIDTFGRLKIGIDYFGFSHRTDRTVLNVRGKLSIEGDYAIGRGCRFDIGRNGVVVIGKGGYINGFTNLIIMHSLRIGSNCAISWNCQFLDDDFHEILYNGQKQSSEHSIDIGDNVWIGCGVKIYKGVRIPNGCVVASDSIVKGVFDVENSLIGGNPARILKENISWS